MGDSGSLLCRDTVESSDGGNAFAAAWHPRGVARVDGQIVVEGIMTCALGPQRWEDARLVWVQIETVVDLTLTNVSPFGSAGSWCQKKSKHPTGKDYPDIPKCMMSTSSARRKDHFQER